MTETYKIEAAKRFNDRIRIRPTDLFWPQQSTTPEPEPETTPLEDLVEAQLDLFRVVLDTMTLGRVA